jgi:GNAT superfamily N-acetyltransferase
VTLTTRRARDDEREAVATIHRASATAAYECIFRPGGAFPWTQTVERWRDFAGEIFVAKVPDADGPIGFVAFDSHELHALYLLPEYWNRGIGRNRAFLNFGSYEINFRARRFYEGHGSRTDGIQRQADGVIELRYGAPSTSQN